MNLFKRHIGRRVAGVGVGVALLVLGLEAPAFAVPTVTSFTPTSGPTDCVVAITGTGFTDFPIADTDVDFVNTADATDITPAADFARISGTEIWAVVPALTPGDTYNIRYDDPSTSGVTSTGTFSSTSGAGACAPTITSFAPTCGAAGTTVVITGTNLIAPDLLGAFVGFNPYVPDVAVGSVGNAQHTVPDVDTTTSVSVVVPTGAADGPIKVTTYGAATGGQVFSTTAFQVPPPDCVPVGGTPHARAITLKLAKHLVAKGKVSSTEDPAFAECVASVPVKIQRRVSGSWKNVGSTTTSDTGTYKKKIKDKTGKYRARAKKVLLNDGADICSKATSPVRKHTH